MNRKMCLLNVFYFLYIFVDEVWLSYEILQDLRQTVCFLLSCYERKLLPLLLHTFLYLSQVFPDIFFIHSAFVLAMENQQEKKRH